MDSLKPVIHELDSVIANLDSVLQSEGPVNVTKNSTPKKLKKKCKSSTEVAVPPSITQFHQLDLRVGKVLHVANHTEKLYALKVDYGEFGERSVCAGLKGFVKAEALLNHLFVTITNLKPRTLCGVLSEAMILAGSTESGKVKEVIPLEAPDGSLPGDIIQFQGLTGFPTVTEGKYVSSKNWERCCARLQVKNGQACYGDAALTVNGKPITCTLPDGAEIH